MKKPKPPKHPYCHYANPINYIIGRVSPSAVMCVNNKETEKHWTEYRKHKADMIKYKIEKRTCTKEEYKTFVRIKKKGLQKPSVKFWRDKNDER